MKFSTRGFTLVELMIVIAIIGILAAALFPSLTAYLKRSRDAGRSANLNTIATAVNGYYSDKEYYPLAVASGCVGGPVGFTDTVANRNSYFPKGIPMDSKSSQNVCGITSGNLAWYGYGSTGSATQPLTYILSAVMENISGGNAKNPPTVVATGASATQPTLEKGTGSLFIITN